MTQSRTTSLDGGIATTVLGRTGLRVSRAAFGGLDTLDQAGFERGVELGVNFLISFPGYPREQRAIGRAARRVDRDAIVLAAGDSRQRFSTLVAGLRERRCSTMPPSP